MQERERILPACGPPALIRPSLPPLLWFAAAVCFGVVIAEEAMWRGRLVVTPICVMEAAAALAFAVAMILGRDTRGAGYLCALGILCGIASGSLSWASTNAVASRLAASSTGRVEVEVLADPVVGRFGASSTCRVVQPPEGRGAKVRVQWPSGEAPPEAGELAAVAGAFTAAPSAERRRSDLQAGISATLRASTVRQLGRAPTVRGIFLPVRLWAVQRIREVRGRGGDLLAGILVGDRRRLAGTEADANFRTAGLTHLVAVSGSHLVVVAALVGLACSALGLKHGWRSLVVLAVVSSYVVFSGVQISAVRALLMSAVTFGCPFSGRRGDSAAALALTVAVMVALDSRATFDLGFQLSVGAVLGLVLFGRLFERWSEAALPRALSPLAGPLSLTLAAQAATLPLIARTFGVVSLVSPIANILVGPLVAVALVLGAVGLLAAGAWSVLGGMVLNVAGALCALSVDMAARLAALPSAAILADRFVLAVTVLCAASLPLVWGLWPQPTGHRPRRAAYGLALIVALAAYGPPVGGGPSMTVMDVGQGDAILLRDGSAGVLVDTGPSSQVLREALGRAGVRHLDAVLLTHDHADHTGGLGGLQGAVRCDAVMKSAAFDRGEPGDQQPHDAGNAKPTDAATPLQAGDSVSAGRWRLTVLWPTSDGVFDNTNDTSLVVLASCGDFRALLTGDAESSVLNQLRTAGQLEDVDAFKVGHHGSRDGVNESELDVLKPELALISVGAGNKFGHPASETLGVLGKHRCAVLRTDESGDVTIRIRGGGKGFAVHTARESKRRGYATIAVSPYAPQKTGACTPDGRRSQRPQAGLPHIRTAGTALGAGARASQNAFGQSRGSRLQPADIPRRERTCRRDYRRLQHHALHVRAPPCHRPRSREDGEGGSGRVGRIRT